MRRTTALLASLALVLSMAPAVALAAPSTTDSWIVTLRSDVDSRSAAAALARTHGGEVGHIYQHALNGFSFRGSAAAASAMARNPQVARVEADAQVWLDTTQTNATWGLDRIDQRTSSLDGNYTYNSTGAGVTAYVIDSGILTGHQEFGGRATLGRDLIGTNGGQDCNGHGTHVAGTIGGSTYGVAKAVSLIAVRVFDCTGGSSWSTIIAGVDWVTGHHTTGPAVANMSLGGGANSSVDDAVREMIADGVATAVAAGNGNFIGRQDDACKYSPARVAEAMTISATDRTDAKASWANYGNCVDWFAPGVSITSAWIDHDTDTNTISGTSMATPHTAGVAALYLQANPGATPATVSTAIYDATSKGVVTSSSTTNNHLLYSLLTEGGGDGGGETDTIPPTVSISSPAAGSTVSGTVSVVANAADAGGVKEVEFFVDTVSIGKDANGSDGWSANWNTTSFSNASHALTARATDMANNSATSSAVSVTVSNATSTNSMSTTLAAITSGSGPNWTANVTVTVRDAGNNLVSGATVRWTWSAGATGSGSCVTGATGACSDSRSQHKKVGSVTFTLDSVTHQSLTWTGSTKSLTVFKP